MNKKIIILIVTVVCCIFPILSYASNVEINLKSGWEEYKLAETNTKVSVFVELGNFINIEEGNPLGFTGTLEYDKTILENVEVQGKEGWSISYNAGNNKIVGDTINANQNTQIAEIVLSVKENVNIQNEKTKIELKDVAISDGNFEITTDISLEVNINVNNRKQDVQEIKAYTTISGERIETTTISSQKDKLPSAGNKIGLIIAIVVVAVLIVIFRIKARKIKY